ncbi:MAG: hypothetical protein Q4Q53_08120, partial [Methanocorpusculum sp.]|nr:hypothetical protein [Methanocorpusculum sp.]
TIKISLFGKSTSNMNGKTVASKSGLDFNITEIIRGYSASYLEFTTPEGGKTPWLGNADSNNPDFWNADHNVFTVNKLSDYDVSVGTWKVNAVVKNTSGISFLDGKSTKTGKSSYSFTVGTISNSITTNRDTVVRGNSFLVTIKGTPGEIVNVTYDTANLKHTLGQSGVTDIADGFQTTLLSSSGSRTIQLDTNSYTEPKSYRITANFSIDNSEKAVKVSVEKGKITIVSDADKYYTGNEIILSGTNTEAKSTYIYINCSDNKLKEILLNDGKYLEKVNVESDNTWSKKFKISDSYPNGDYTIYATSYPYAYSAEGKPYVTINENYAHSTQPIKIKEPSLTASVKENIVFKGGNAEIIGATEDCVESLSYYIIGNGIFQYGTIFLNQDGTFSKAINTTNFAVGNYQMIIQNPSYDKLFNVMAGVDKYGCEEDNFYNSVSSFTTDSYGDLGVPVRESVSSINTLSTQNAVDAITNLLNKDYVDDIYNIVNFEVSSSKPISATGKISLQSGWNFISIPKTLASSNNTAEKLFGKINTDEKAVLSYNAETQKWEQLQKDTYIAPLTGYWIYSKNPAEINLYYTTNPSAPAVKTVYKGWNAVGLSAEEQTSAKSALARIKWGTAIEWNLPSGKYSTAIVNGGSSTNSPERLLTPGNGIWLYAEEEGTLTGLTA